LFGVVVVLATWKLWVGNVDIPRIPATRLLLNVPTGNDGALLGLLLVSLAGFGLSASWPRGRRVAASVACLTLAVFVLLDQNRLQVWGWHLAWLMIVLAIDNGRRGLQAVLLLTAGIYAWSAVSKFDIVFADTLGPYLVGGLLQSLGMSVDVSAWPIGWQRAAALSLPIGEFITAVCLFVPRLRFAGCVLSLFQHGILLFMLGPLGLNHSRSVLLWNIYFLGQNVLLTIFVRSEQPASGYLWNSSLAVRVAWIPVLLPILHTVGWLDHWPAWAVYSPRQERVRLFVESPQFGGQPWIDTPAAGQNLVQLRLDRYALEVTNAPIYPQDRVQIGWILDRLQSDAYVVWESPANPWTGTRTRREFWTREELSDFANNRFRLNFQPRESPANP
jgi:hypothetical protein